ncbi:MAG: helix-turn-helix transcriptional regulator [Ruminococcaceae bacterium]|nr:helix-turn-helix transcriptional regulator [Oscillospiraceae bacterium]
MKPMRLYRKFPDPSFPLQLTYYRVRRIMPNFTNIHWHPEPELLYAPEGTYEIYSDSGNFTLLAGEVCLIPTGKIHSIRSLTPSGQYWSISFSIDLIQLPESHFFQKSFVEPLKNGNFQIPDKFTAKDLTSNALQALQKVVTGKQNEQFLGLLTFFLEIQPLCKLVPTTRNLRQCHDAIASCIRYMETNYASRITLEELANHVHLHPNYLCAAFKRNSGQTPFAYLNVLRIRKARALLMQGRLSIAQVAEQVGFADTDHFSRTFKQIQGISPSAYRKTYNEN